MKRPIIGKTTIEQFIQPCEVCGYSISDGHKCFKEKFKLYKPVDERTIFTVMGYSKIDQKHIIMNSCMDVMSVHLSDYFDYTDEKSLIGLKIVRKIKLLNGKKKHDQ